MSNPFFTFSSIEHESTLKTHICRALKKRTITDQEQTRAYLSTYSQGVVSELSESSNRAVQCYDSLTNDCCRGADSS